MKLNNFQNNVLNVQCGAIHYQSTISTFSDVPQFEELTQPCRCYLVEYTNGGSKFYFSKPGVFGPDGTFITAVMKEDAPRNGERYFNDAYQDDPSVFSTTLTLTNQQMLGGTGFMFRQKFDTWIGAFMGQLTPVERQSLDSKVPDGWMQIFQQNSPSALPEHTVFDVMAVNGLDQFARLCFAADIFFIKATINSEDKENVDTLWSYEFSEVCFLQVIDPILKQPRDFDVPEFLDVKVSWLEKSSRYLVSFPNEKEQDKMHHFFENVNFARKINHGVNVKIPFLPDIYQGKGQVNRRTIEDYLLSIDLAFSGESHFVDIPVAAGVLHRFQFFNVSDSEIQQSGDELVAADSPTNEAENGLSSVDSVIVVSVSETVVTPVVTGRNSTVKIISSQPENKSVEVSKKSNGKLSRVSLFLVLCIVLLVVIFPFTKYNSKASFPDKKTVGVFEPSKVLKPSFETAIEQIFGIQTAGGSVLTKKEYLTSLFVEVPFKAEGIDHRVIFLQTQKIDRLTGKIEDCHICMASISAVVYKRIGNEWISISANRDFTVFGSWGVASILKPVEISYKIKKNMVAFLFEYGSSGQGYSIGGKAIFGFSGDTWSDLGYVVTHESNDGTCDDILAETKETSGFSRCWKNTGRLQIEAGKLGEYSSIRVVKSGTESDINGKVTPAKNVKYEYTTGRGYEIKK